jgi:hypothetical protein
VGRDVHLWGTAASQIFRTEAATVQVADQLAYLLIATQLDSLLGFIQLRCGLRKWFESDPNRINLRSFRNLPTLRNTIAKASTTKR